MMKCKIFGHKWNKYKVETTKEVEPTKHTVGFSYHKIDEFRICKRCHYKQIRLHYTGRESDWHEWELNTDELRDKKLKELGI